MQRESKYSVEESHRLLQKHLAVILPEVQEGNHGKYLCVDLDTGSYELDGNPVPASQRMRERLPDAECVIYRIGYPRGPRLGWKGFLWLGR